MLPHNKLGRQQIKKLKVYAGPEHPHAAQWPAAVPDHPGRAVVRAPAPTKQREDQWQCRTPPLTRPSSTRPPMRPPKRPSARYTSESPAARPGRHPRDHHRARERHRSPQGGRRPRATDSRNGRWTINGRDLESYFPNKVHQQRPSTSPSSPRGRGVAFDVVARIHGGGISGQAGALRLGVSPCPQRDRRGGQPPDTEEGRASSLAIRGPRSARSTA